MTLASSARLEPVSLDERVEPETAASRRVSLGVAASSSVLPSDGQVPRSAHVTSMQPALKQTADNA